MDLPPPPASASPSNNDLVERFADESNRFGATNQQVLSPVPRTDDRPMVGVGPSTPAATSTQPNAWDAFSSPSSSSVAAQTTPTQGGAPRSATFPELRSPDNSAPASENVWDSRFNSAPAATPTGGGFASERSSVNPASAGSGDSTSAPLTGWAGNQANATNAAPASTSSAATAASERSLMEGVIMIALGAGMCFTWIAYIDVRNKYLALLRGAPGSGYSTAA
jgi:hypothetical protein